MVKNRNLDKTDCNYIRETKRYPMTNILYIKGMKIKVA